jgi:hypothetical protein
MTGHKGRDFTRDKEGTILIRKKSEDHSMSIEAILRRLDIPGSDSLNLLRVYRNDEESRALWRESPRLYRAFSRRLIQAGHPTRAFELVREGLEAHPKDEDLEFLGALALRRGGNMQRAAEYATKLLDRTDLRPEARLEALSLAGSIEKERYIRSTRTDPGPDPDLARRSAALYLKAHELSRDETLFSDRNHELFPGINAATMSFLADETEVAKAMARSVLDRAEAERAKPDSDGDYWLKATIGEAMLLLGDLGGSAHWYSNAVKQAREEGRDGDIAAMRRNFQLLRFKIPLDEKEWGFFNVGNVVAFAGHLLDHPARPTTVDLPSRFPNDPVLVERVAEEIDEYLDYLNARVGYCSVACGSDILFAERMLERRAELHVVLPFDLGDFYQTSVDYGLSDHEMKTWRSRCDRVLGMADQVHHATTEKYLGDDVLFAFANAFIQGLAILRAAERGVDPFALVVLDDQAPRGVLPGGTADFLGKWAERGLESRVIDLKGLREEVGTIPARPVLSKPLGPTAARVRRKTMVMLFADVKNFSKLDDDRFPDFFAAFLDEVKHVIDEKPPSPSFINTWGDGLYVVFDRVVDAADFALRLVDRVRGVGWASLGLPEDTTVRIGVHAGPVYQQRAVRGHAGRRGRASVLLRIRRHRGAGQGIRSLPALFARTSMIGHGPLGRRARYRDRKGLRPSGPELSPAGDSRSGALPPTADRLGNFCRMA